MSSDFSCSKLLTSLPNLPSNSLCNSLACLSAVLDPLSVIVFDHDIFEAFTNPFHPGHFQKQHLIFLSLVWLASRNKVSMHWCKYGDSLKSALNLISYVSINELYILHCFGRSLACLDHSNNVVSIYGYYVLKDPSRKQFVQIG